MPETEVVQTFPALLRVQLRRGFTIAQQYLAAAVYFDSKRLPRLANHCYVRSERHRGHALRMVRHLLDRDLGVAVEGLDEIVSTFESPRAAIAFLLAAERVYTAEITALAASARTSADYLGERFVQWFMKDQVAEVSGMSRLLTVIDRAAGDLFDVEQFLARESRTAPPVDNMAPKMAGPQRN
ncbi:MULTISPECIES: ferritin [Nocardia]|uniref:Ferritin n=1 Tax=Nocardia arthritidis TaxID=228602 RepID=A0A6G9Y484_9NOCA|nr:MULTISPECIES: ferritin-like domain-containing protein [Nocardia]QIS08038.1 ferritin [Nocardia arthritidis]